MCDLNGIQFLSTLRKSRYSRAFSLRSFDMSPTQSGKTKTFLSCWIKSRQVGMMSILAANPATQISCGLCEKIMDLLCSDLMALRCLFVRKFTLWKFSEDSILENLPKSPLPIKLCLGRYPNSESFR